MLTPRNPRSSLAGDARAESAERPGPADLAAQLGMDYVELAETAVDEALVRRFPARILFRDSVIPISMVRSHCVQLAVSDPFRLEGLDELSRGTGFTFETVLAERRAIEAKLHTLLGVGGGTISGLVSKTPRGAEENPDSSQVIEDDSGEASVIKLVNELLTEALQQGASDIHLEPSNRGLDIRFRVDGLLRPQPLAADIHRFSLAIISRLKIMARLNIAEKRLPQDGRIRMQIQNRDIDIRVSVIPMVHGEGVVMRLLDRSRSILPLDRMRFPDAVLESWSQAIQKPHGMVLVTGPTGSGKTTTLYASLAEICKSTRKIITIEDPVEYHLDGISQIQVHGKIGLTFATGLRSVLRHDPDVILIGEIRDSETAISAIQAALTGHLVFSTLHTNDAASAFTRLTDMGIEPYLVASTVHAVLAQRLVRRLCQACRRPVNRCELELPNDLPIDPNAMFYLPNGCRLCHGTGYKGRLAIFELLKTDTSIRELCNRRVDSQVIRQQAMRSGMQGLRESGLRIVESGETTWDEILRAASEEDAISSLPDGATARQGE